METVMIMMPNAGSDLTAGGKPVSVKPEAVSGLGKVFSQIYEEVCAGGKTAKEESKKEDNLLPFSAQFAFLAAPVINTAEPAGLNYSNEIPKLDDNCCPDKLSSGSFAGGALLNKTVNAAFNFGAVETVPITASFQPGNANFTITDNVPSAAKADGVAVIPRPKNLAAGNEVEAKLALTVQIQENGEVTRLAGNIFGIGVAAESTDSEVSIAEAGIAGNEARQNSAKYSQSSRFTYSAAGVGGNNFLSSEIAVNNPDMAKAQTDVSLPVMHDRGMLTFGIDNWPSDGGKDLRGQSAEPQAGVKTEPEIDNVVEATDDNAFKHVFNTVQSVKENETIGLTGNSESTVKGTTVTDPYDVAGQIVKQAHLIKHSDGSRMVIQLKPEHLGELVLTVTVDQGMVSATFHTSNQEVRSIIEASLPQLRQDMSGQGLKVDHVGVQAEIGQFFSGSYREQPKSHMVKTDPKKRSLIEAIEYLEAVETVTGDKQEAGIDYRV